MKTTIEFYLIAAINTEQVFHTACLLAEKAHRQQHTVYIYAESADTVQALDSLLWSFRDDSFVPHQLWASGTAVTAPVLLGCPESPAPPACDVLINLTSIAPDFYRQFQRIAELIPEEPTARQMARERYRYYKSQGCELVTRQGVEAQGA